MLIGEVAKKFGLSTDTLRFYEKEGLLMPVAKSASGNRDYNEYDLRRIEFVKCMRDAGMSIEALKRYLDLFQQGNETIEERKQLLEAENKRIKEQLKKLQAASEKLDYKLNLSGEGKIDEYLKSIQKEKS